MPYRVSFETEGVARRHLLKRGENLLGSATSSDITIRDPSISRSHAVLVVGERVQLADLGSANGTYVGSARISSPTDLVVGDQVLLGSVALVLEELGERDAEPAPQVASMERTTAGASGNSFPATAKTTASSHPIQLLSLLLLPQLIDTLQQQRPLVELAQMLGKGLFDIFPVEELTIGQIDGALLFSAQRPAKEGSQSAATETSVATSGLELTMTSNQRSSIAMASPLLEASLKLVSHAAADTHHVPEDVGTAVLAGDTLTSLDPVMSRLLDQAAKIAKGDVSVLILGESGTGKELFASTLHAHSGREPLITLNCAALPSDLLEAELFGIESGVATGVDARPGRFEQAHGGTLFLDEIGDMSMAVQAKVLRVMETGEVSRIGGASRPAQARLLSATNRDLAAMVEAGDFRLDLYHRIADWEVTLPPLRDRPADLPNLISLFLAQESRVRGIRIRGISREALSVFQAHDWPGNVRELQREIRRAALLLTDNDLLDMQSLSERVKPKEHGPTSLEDRLLAAERCELERALIENGGQASAAAAALSVPLSSFYRRLKAVGLKDEPT